MRTIAIPAALLLLLLAPACQRKTNATPEGTKAPSSAPKTLLPFGATCTTNADCRSNACFVGGSAQFCSIVCAQATAATDCPVPPTSGMCNKHGFCKKP